MHRGYEFARRATAAVSSCRNLSGVSHFVATLRLGIFAEEKASGLPVSAPWPGEREKHGNTEAHLMQ